MDNIKWLTENGGPSLKLHMMNESMIVKDTYDTDELINELLQIEKVQTVISYFDDFKDYKSTPENELHSKIHSKYDYCYEMFMPFLTKLGFKAGMSVLDEKVKYMLDIVKYLTTLNDSNELLWGHSYRVNILVYLLEAGYCNSDTISYLTSIINKGHKIAKLQEFDFYETDPMKIKRRPEMWEDKPVLKDIHICATGDIPVPNSYHIMAFQYIYKFISDEETNQKIREIINYILDPRYQIKRGDYGCFWDTKVKQYYASGKGVHLPLFETDELHGYEKSYLLNVMNIMSYTHIAVNTKWFHKCMEFLNRYRTEHGTYIFPEDFLKRHLYLRPADTATIYKAFIPRYKNVKRNDKRRYINELYSTFFVELMKKRMNMQPCERKDIK